MTNKWWLSCSIEEHQILQTLHVFFFHAQLNFVNIKIPTKYDTNLTTYVNFQIITFNFLLT